MPGGRPKGAVNHDKRSLLQRCQEALGKPDWHPVVEMAKVADDPNEDQSMRQAARKEVAKYTAPQLKAIDLTSTGGGITLNVNTSVPRAEKDK